ncbi:glycosyltransferase involved in cell wall biosynthesis [Flavobacterium sp. W4I14]|nr:glycosyltransferase involved in cell wall biosynthesis [Flavobacterium sp. W4I14]
MNVLFSIIIPTYNRSSRLKKALDGLASQTFKNFEVIICDDGSVDDTQQVVNKYCDKLNLRYIWNENWGGPARPRNIGIKESSGEWICFLDSDDWWYSNKLEECAKYIADYDFLFHSVDIFNAKTNSLTAKKVGRALGDNPFKDLILNGNGIANSSVVIKKSVCEKIGEISEEKTLIAVEDYDYWLRATKNSSRVKFLNLSLGAYYWDGDSNISQISMDRITKEITIFNKYLANLNLSEQKQATYIFNYKIGRYYGLLNNYSEARKYLLSSMSSNKISIRLKSLAFYLKFLLK